MFLNSLQVPALQFLNVHTVYNHCLDEFYKCYIFTVDWTIANTLMLKPNQFKITIENVLYKFMPKQFNMTKNILRQGSY